MRKSQSAFVCRNRPCVHRNDGFYVRYLRSRAFAFVCISKYHSRLTARVCDVSDAGNISSDVPSLLSLTVQRVGLS